MNVTVHVTRIQNIEIQPEFVNKALNKGIQVGTFKRYTGSEDKTFFVFDIQFKFFVKHQKTRGEILTLWNRLYRDRLLMEESLVCVSSTLK